MPRSKSDVRQRKLVKQINALASSGANVVPKQPFNRLVREVLQSEGEYSIRGEAVEALQCASEDFITEVFAKANNLSHYASRDTVTQHDLRMALGANSTERGKAEVPELLRGQPEPVEE
jgi:histone H3/H4|tara:strand:+ start:1336 stop:1692 length:357 start_codon:yes stop_codon:yes gene_type:complete